MDYKKKYLKYKLKYLNLQKYLKGGAIRREREPRPDGVHEDEIQIIVKLFKQYINFCIDKDIFDLNINNGGRFRADLSEYLDRNLNNIKNSLLEYKTTLIQPKKEKEIIDELTEYYNNRNNNREGSVPEYVKNKFNEIINSAKYVYEEEKIRKEIMEMMGF
tara:strand:+ start:518 stop:1000 length:483 start_codon:yes stop_codon:yes gene_type:complete